MDEKKRDNTAVRAKLDNLLREYYAELLARGAADKEAFLDTVLERAAARDSEAAGATHSEHA